MEKEIKHIEATTEINEKGQLIAIASDESEDRVGDSLKVNTWDFKDFMNNPVLQAGHDYRPQFTIGVAKNLRIEGKRVLFDPVFHTITALAREIKEMYEQGVLKAWSVGYQPAEYTKNKKNQLLEVSAVAVPANANALVIAKAMNQEQEKEVEKELKTWVTSTSSDIEWKDAEKEGLNIKEAMEHLDKLEEEEEEEEETVVKKSKKKSIKKKKKIKKEDKKKDDDKKETKSPACRIDDESVADCRARKIPEIMKEDSNITQDQAVAMAIGMCNKLCSEKDEEPKKEEEKKPKKKQQYECECIECGHKVTSSSHCKDIKCSECGGQMRRAERPGPGQKEKSETKKKKISAKKKVGRVLSKTTRTRIAESIDILNKTVVELDKLLKLNDTPKEEAPKEPTLEEQPKEMPKETPVKSRDDRNGREPREVHKQSFSENELAVRALKKIAKNSNFLLCNINKKKQNK